MLVEFVINFFRDTLDGPVYVIVSVLCGILICSCIGYLGEQYLKKKESEKEFNETHAVVSDANPTTNVATISGEVNQNQK